MSLIHSLFLSRLWQYLLEESYSLEALKSCICLRKVLCWHTLAVSFTKAVYHRLALLNRSKNFSHSKPHKRQQGKLDPLSGGVLIYDEVKVISRLMWNSRSQTIIGLAVNADDQASLCVVYDRDSAVEPIGYIMQFLWRDLTSFIVESHYTSSETLMPLKLFIHVFLRLYIEPFQVEDCKK